MHLLTPILTVLFALIATLSTLPLASAGSWNELLKVWDIGRVSSNGNAPSKWAYRCGGIPEGGYACGAFQTRKLRVIYRCEKGWLKYTEMCKGDNVCVKNSRKKHKKFYPAVKDDKIVCVERKRALAP